jgi:hypothetical protein
MTKVIEEQSHDWEMRRKIFVSNGVSLLLILINSKLSLLRVDAKTTT